MKENIGIRPYHTLTVDELKKDLLFFDRIHIVGLKELKEAKFNNEYKNYLLNEINYLCKCGIIIENEDEIVWGKQVRNPLSPELIQEGRDIGDYFLEETGKALKNKTIFTRKFRIFHLNLLARSRASLFNCREGINAFSIVDDLSLPEALKNKKELVLKISLKYFPTPDELTTWDEIFEFKNDLDSKGKFLGFRLWLENKFKETTDLDILEDEINYNLFLIQEKIKLHNLKTKKSLFEFIIVGGAELIENISKLRLEKVANSLFFIKKRKINILETELNLTEPRFGYLTIVNKYFKGIETI